MHTATDRSRRRGFNSRNKRRVFSGTQDKKRRPFRGSRNGGHTSTRHQRGGGRTARKLATFDPSQFINKNPVEVVEDVYTPTHTFKDFGFVHKVVAGIDARGITIPTPIQDKVIPHILEDKDVIGLAETGTGKTAAFLLPLIHKTVTEHRRQTLILAPTRELAIQIQEELRALTKGLTIYSTTCVGGVNITPQIRGLKRHNHFIIGTPGRVLDLIQRKCFNPKNITTVVLDEADRMLDMGFIHDMRTILGETPTERETLFFSATMSPDIEKLVHDFLRDPVTVSVKKKAVTDSILQDVIQYETHTKVNTLLTLLKDDTCSRVIVFGAMKHSVEKLAKELSRNGINAESIHGNKSHSQRQRSLTRFKSGAARVLVATDVAARGIHVDDVSHVVNYDLPQTFEDYVHRIGRTGRGNKRGKALTFIAA